MTQLSSTNLQQKLGFQKLPYLNSCSVGKLEGKRGFGSGTGGGEEGEG